MLTLIQALGHTSVAGGWIALPAVLATGVIGACSGGFRRGPAWSQRAAFGAGLLGLTLPLLIIALNA